jgi:hypothetical protein
MTQPMQTAPRDGRAIRAFDHLGRSYVARWMRPSDTPAVGVWWLADGWRRLYDFAGWEAI